MKIKSILISIFSIALAVYIFMLPSNNPLTASVKEMMTDSTKNSEGESMENKIVKSEEEWKKELTPEQYRVLREKGTERAFTGKYDDHHEKGIYKCAACGSELFSSDHKYDSGCGWPSYWTAMAKDKIILQEDRSYGMIRTEVLCAKCGSHLGHVFDDGPEPTGLRYCINSVSLDFEKTGEIK